MIFTSLGSVLYPQNSQAQSSASGADNKTKKAAKQFSLADIPGMRFTPDIPINFPLPSYNSNVVHKSFINSTKGPPSASLTLITRDQPEVVYEWYKATCRNGGWTFSTPKPQATSKLSKIGTLYMIDAKKDRNQVRIFCFPDKKTQGTSVGIAWCKTKP